MEETMSDLHQQIFVAEYAASRSKGLTPQHALALAWNAAELFADSAASKAAEAAGRLDALDAVRETVAKCERLLAQARAVMLGESELDEAAFAELLAEISSVIDEQEVER
jgi:hypothetical protein